MTSALPEESQKKSEEKTITAGIATKDEAGGSAPAHADGEAATNNEKVTSTKNAANENASPSNAHPKTAAAATTPTTKNAAKPAKIKVHLVAVGSAPILKKSKFLMNADDRFAVAIAFLRKVLKRSSSSNAASAGGGAAAVTANGSSLFLYVNAAFVPSPDERIGDLFDCFGTRGELVVHYSLQEAWG
mmetsp:Transcript_7215/g.12746  ORF Transcript_7215/g.12746 Transcript_7215/m.12746 type:complete len:188 (+) Transcript_7215:255-818(+)|eukprot:CAMPEP_0183757844 /NCGR_PEP_ID=MMETSP0739-20130205/6019_1 /TAXON_ID=385413 /ORGANISM="Thalassiosira miniscula, Strain CCMP1093" /LENGTH=187 /DNA_ID=CAMNT_0025995353 /DNA_START=185 /DNA_END=748 /DNA_ORIENTATION=-